MKRHVIIQILSFPVGGQYVTVRGCAPFNTETFSVGFQRGFVGTYWRGRSLFSLCDYDNCNSASGITASFASLAFALFVSKLF